MDPVTLAATAVSLMVPFLRRLAEGLVDRAGSDLGDAASAKVLALYDQVKAKLTGDDYNAALLKGIEANPDSQSRQANFQRALVEQMQQDDAFRATLERLVADAKAAGAVSIQATETGAVAGHDFIQQGRTNIGRDQANYGDPTSERREA